MRLSISEIRANAMEFAAEWREGASERADAQSFWNDFFRVFGIKRRSVASFEEKVKNLSGAMDRIDVFYSGVMLGEHKSRGEDLSKAASQAFNYIQHLTREGRHHEIPRHIVVSDFANFALYDLESETPGEPVATFPTAKFHENIRYFGFLSGYESRPIEPEDPINIRAVEILGELHDALERGGYLGHRLERFLVRVLFCLFADDTAIFEPDTFKLMVRETRSDGSDLGAMLARLFKVLDTPKEDRSDLLPDEFKELPYVNGELFKEELGFAEFNSEMRAALEKCCEFNWARISPAVFGSLFQSIMDGGARRQIGAHYTSERDILKVVRSLFLDDLHAEFKKSKGNKKKLTALHHKLADLKFLDPACGCGNFLVITYRELRLLELDILKELNRLAHKTNDQLRLSTMLLIDVDQMHGIEIEEWPARIAEVAMWLIDHQMNQRVSEAFGVPVLRLPLLKIAKIHIGNALRIDWNEVLPAKHCSFVLGNPPFVGKKEQNRDQKEDMVQVWNRRSGTGSIDYVSCWYLRAVAFMKGTRIRAAFVSTNSITQGEQVAIIWDFLFSLGLRIHFAHRTFPWTSEARGRAHVHVVIIGFAMFECTEKWLYEYPEKSDTPNSLVVRNINQYLVDGPNISISRSRSPLSPNAPVMSKGSEVTDDGHLLLNRPERDKILQTCPQVGHLIRYFTGGDEFINGVERFCFWLRDANPNEYRHCSEIRSRLKKVREFRLESPKLRTVNLADSPHLFGEYRQPVTEYLLVPKVSSKERQYIPIGFLPPEVVVSGSAIVIPSATRFEFGVLLSEMHMAWVRQVCGRTKSDYQYSVSIVYNNFPWPQDVTVKQREAVEEAAEGVLAAREAFPDQTLADLYDPLAMPKPLREAHKKLDRAVDRCYRKQPFDSERQRVEFLFGLYQKLTTPLLDPPKRKRLRKSSQSADHAD